MLKLFDANEIFIFLWGYGMSHLEFWATLTGGIAVWLSAKENVWSWVIGLLNVTLAFFLFYQIQLYPDMFLQVFFFITNIIGFWQWKFPKKGNENNRNELKISKLTVRQFSIIGAAGCVGTLAFGSFAKNLHQIFPQLFSLPSAFPFMDSFITVMSIVATFLLIRKKVEAWWMWLGIDILATYMYFVKDIKLYSLLYFVFCIIATVGAVEWTKKFRKETIS
jgi:nicotinamide mononucleotide transporter